MHPPTTPTITLKVTRIQELSLKNVVPKAASGGNVQMKLASGGHLHPEDKKQARVFLNSELTYSDLRLRIVTESFFENSEGFTEDDMNPESGLKKLINIAWKEHLSFVRFLVEGAGYEISRYPESLEEFDRVQ
ncbi:hypothetical protein ES703_11971 [subsurface metagenome]